MRKALVIVVVLVGFAYLGREPLLQAVGNFLVVSDPLVPSDAAIAISGNGPERVWTGMKLIRDGYAHYLIVSGGGPYKGGRNSGLIMRDQAIAAGMPEDRLLVDDRAESTVGNAEGAARLMKARSLRSGILLTSPYHTRRAGLIFSRIFRREGLHVRVLAVDDGHFRVQGWWTRRIQRSLVLREYVKLAAFLGGVR